MSSISSRFKRIIGVLLLSFGFTLLGTNLLMATHLRAGDITVIRTGAHTYRIILKVYTNTKNTDVLFSHGGTGILDFGDGSSIFVPENAGTPRPELGPNINYIEFSVTHTYSGNQNFTISYTETNRNAGVLNMTNSVETPFYIETLITTDPYFGNDSSPVLKVPPIDQGCVGVAWFHNPGASDPDKGDSLSYNLVVPFQDRQTTVTGYKSPADAGFYLDYSHGSENKLNKPSFSIDPISGTITWDSPGRVGEYNIAFVVVEWRKVDGVWRKLGFVRRDMQIIIADDCNDKRPDLIMPKDICVEAGQTIDQKIIGIDPDSGDKVKIEAFSQVFDLSAVSSPATFLPTPDFRLAPDTAKFHWVTNCTHINPQPYSVVFKVTDNSPLRLATYKTWFIKVVAPAPTWKDATLTPPTKSASLEWNSYICNTDAEIMQVWRRIDMVNAAFDSCVTGMPDLGYTLIAEVPLKDANNNPVTKYVDKGLSPGAFYCYRLVAVFPIDKGGSESYVSKDTCIGPFDIDAPIITKVSIDSTSATKGKISVAWVVKPVTIADNFKVYRGNEFTGSFSPTPVYSGKNLSFIDSLLDTENELYHYRVISYDVGNAVVDTSGTASSVRLESRAQVGKITLTWSATVPWSNSVAGMEHEVFRGPEGSKEGDLQSIGLVDVTTSGFQFVDNGPLDNSKKYLYRVKALGSYGSDPSQDYITKPLVNYSQMILAQPGDSIPPCKPDFPLTLNSVDCSDRIKNTPCLVNIFINTLTWNEPDTECKPDILGYKIYYAVNTNSEFIELKTGPDKDQELIVKGNTYNDTLDISYARCYKIASIDRSGNISELTDRVCFDNCIHYELPNVFTPNDDQCNDKFSAYSNRDNPGEGNSVCKNLSEDLLRQRCPRYVQSVVFRVYNRWGNEVYNYTGSSDDEENTIFIDWDGKANNGVRVSSGVYYYIAEVTFDVVNPSKKTKTYKGWVHILYDTEY